MIEGPGWIWLHMPKCAGTATEAALRRCLSGRDDIRFDPVAPARGGAALWHDDIARRRARRPGFDPAGRAVLCNIRRLPEWVLSYVHFEAARAPGAPLPHRAALVRGALLSHRGRPVTPDAILARFAAGTTFWVRCDHLPEDLGHGTGLDPGVIGAALTAANRNRIGYLRALDFWFRPGELAALYAANPLWAALEERVWGDILRLPARAHPARGGGGRRGAGRGAPEAAGASGASGGSVGHPVTPSPTGSAPAR